MLLWIASLGTPTTLYRNPAEGSGTQFSRCFDVFLKVFVWVHLTAVPGATWSHLGSNLGPSWANLAGLGGPTSGQVAPSWVQVGLKWLQDLIFQRFCGTCSCCSTWSWFLKRFVKDFQWFSEVPEHEKLCSRGSAVHILEILGFQDE